MGACQIAFGIDQTPIAQLYPLAVKVEMIRPPHGRQRIRDQHHPPRDRPRAIANSMA
jgi:hypothetical protein